MWRLDVKDLKVTKAKVREILPPVRRIDLFAIRELVHDVLDEQNESRLHKLKVAKERAALPEAERERQGRINRRSLVYAAMPGMLAGAAVADALFNHGSPGALVMGAIGGVAGGGMIGLTVQELVGVVTWARKVRS